MDTIKVLGLDAEGRYKLLKRYLSNKKATEEAFKNLISQAYSSIYESVFTVTKKWKMMEIGEVY